MGKMKLFQIIHVITTCLSSVLQSYLWSRLWDGSLPIYLLHHWVIIYWSQIIFRITNFSWLPTILIIVLPVDGNAYLMAYNHNSPAYNGRRASPSPGPRRAAVWRWWPSSWCLRYPQPGMSLRWLIKCSKQGVLERRQVLKMHGSCTLNCSLSI